MQEDTTTLLEQALATEKTARKQAEKALARKTEELAQLEHRYNNLADAYVMIDLEGNVLKMNARAAHFFGLDQRNEPLNVLSLVHPDDFEKAVESFKKMQEKGTFIGYKARIFTKSGELKLIHINANMVYDKGGNPAGAEGIVRDITDEAKVRQLVEDQRTQLSIIFNNSPLGITLSENGTIKNSNRAFREMLGYTPEQVMKLRASDLLMPEESEDLAEVLKEMDDGKKSHEERIMHFRKEDGSFILAKLIITSIMDESGKSRYRLSLIEDITEKLRDRETLEHQEKQLAIIVEESPLGIVLAKDGLITKTNAAFRKQMGYSEKELLQLALKDISGEGDEEAAANFQKLDKGELDHFTINKYCKRKNGSQFPIRANINAVRGPQGTVEFQVAIIEDISEQVQHEKQQQELLNRLEKSNLELQEYAHVVSHDLKSPLRSISALVNWIREDYREVFDQGGLDNLRLIEDTLEKMENLINGILAYSSIDRSEQENTLVDLQKIAEEILRLMHIPEHIHVSIVRPLPRVKGDRVRLQQLFQNLISNAVRYIDKKKGEVVIDCHERSDHFIFSVRDNGLGIAKAHHERIFSMFESLSDSDNSTGLGLAIVKKIVDLYGGEIYLESEEGVGTTFFIRLNK